MASNLRHLAMIMDGNRRWARENNVSLLYDDSSQKAVEAAMSFCQKHEIDHLSLYTLSIENLNNREPALLSRLFDMLYELCTTKKKEIVNRNMRVRFVGQRDLFPSRLRSVIVDLERATQEANGLQLNILFCYGGQQEIAAACAQVAGKVVAGELTLGAISPETVQAHLGTAHAPPPDLIIRAGKASRLSNFMLFQAAYSELLFLDCYWPEITAEKLEECRNTYLGIQRNFGQ